MRVNISTSTHLQNSVCLYYPGEPALPLLLLPSELCR